MRMDQLLERLELEALDEWDKLFAKRSLEKAQLIFSPEVKAAQDRKRISDLQFDTATIRNELQLKRELEAERQKHARAVLELENASMTIDERIERNAEIHRFQTLFAWICPEASPRWREEATAAFKAKRKR
jgi:hypothetical protein